MCAQKMCTARLQILRIRKVAKVYERYAVARPERLLEKLRFRSENKETIRHTAGFSYSRKHNCAGKNGAVVDLIYASF